MITLLDGRQVALSNISFDSDTYHFTLIDTGEDVTNLISRADKLANWPDFDPTIDNTRASNEASGGTGPVAPLNTSTASIFTNQILTDPLAAPISALNSAVAELSASSGIQKIGLILGLGLAAIVLVEVLKK